ncbi:MAG: anthrone oxygenase family protein [Pseudomonadota bacterium]
MDLLVNSLLWFSIVSAGIMAGVYFTFSAFAMRAFAELGDEAGARAMQSINRVIVQSAFLPLFFASTLTCAALSVLGLMGFGGANSLLMAAGGGVYVVGMFVVTVAGNVPLNNRLDAVEAGSEEGAGMWRLYLSNWTPFNHIRTLACTASMVLLALCL